MSLKPLPFRPAPGPGGLRGQRVGIWGLGRHGGGLALAQYLLGEGARLAWIIDAQPAKTGSPEAAFLAAHTEIRWLPAPEPVLIDELDWLVVSPAVPPRALDQCPLPPLTSAEAIFARAHRGPRIAITGTKGKSTTAALLGQLLDWPVAGNSWTPLLEHLHLRGPEAPVVCELSSFQLRYLSQDPFHPDIAILTQLDCDHLDWHPDLSDYHQAKLQLLDWAPALVLGRGYQPNPAQAAKLLPQVRVCDKRLALPHGETLMELCELPLLGRHNAENAALAASAALAKGLSPGLIADRCRRFTPLPHRLEPVHQLGGIRFINDSIATNPLASMAAVNAIPGPLAIILGGHHKGADFDGLLRLLGQRQAHIHLIGEAAKVLAAGCRSLGLAATTHPNLAAACSAALTDLQKQHRGVGCVLLAPACASFGEFEDFAARGRAFCELVRQLGAASSAQQTPAC